MRRFLLFIAGFFTIIAVCFVVFSQNEPVIHDQSLSFTLQGPVEKQKAIPVLDIINSRNMQIKNFVTDLKVILQSPNGRSFRLSGFFYYEKERKFHLRLNSILGAEVDIGANGSQFWIWTGRSTPGLYWANFDDLNKSRLITPLNPDWIPMCFGLDTLNYNEYTVDQNDNVKWRVIKPSFSGMKDPVKLVTYVDPNKCLITGHGIYSQLGILDVSSEIQEFHNGLPSKITFISHADKTSLVWYLNNTKINVGIDPIRWQMPNINPKINLVIP